MPPSERLIDDLADAILDASPIDWAAAESSSEGTARLLVRQLRVLGSRIVGSGRHAALSRARGAARAEGPARSDIYSLGVLLYHLVAGSYPVQARTVREVRRAHERSERAAIQTARPDVPPTLGRIIERAIEPRPERRYQSADALGKDLAALQPRRRLIRLAYAAGLAAAAILVAGVGWEVAGRQVGSSRTPSLLLAGFAGLNPVGVVNVSPAQRPMIAVLPLQNLSAEPDSDYFVDGLTDEIIRNLAVINGMEVRSRTSSFAFKDKPRNLRDVGEQLGVNLVVEGSIMRSGSKLRINAQLVSVAGDVPLWAERYDRELKDVFDIQDEIARASRGRSSGWRMRMSWLAGGPRQNKSPPQMITRSAWQSSTPLWETTTAHSWNWIAPLTSSRNVWGSS